MPEQVDLAAVCGGALAAIDASLTPADRAVLRSRSLRSAPLLYGELLRRLPSGHSEEPWLPIVKALGQLRHNIPDGLDEAARRTAFARTAGFFLGRTGYSDIRMTRLLTGRGVRLIQATENALDWLVRQRVGACRLTDLAVLTLGDALGDLDAHASARRRIAIHFARGREAAPRQQPAA